MILWIFNGYTMDFMPHFHTDPSSMKVKGGSKKESETKLQCLSRSRVFREDMFWLVVSIPLKNIGQLG